MIGASANGEYAHRISEIRGVDYGLTCAIRSILSICNALCKGGLLTLPDVPPSVCYPSGRHQQWRGPKPGGKALV